MLLTGKAKEDFENTYSPISRSKIYEHALIIEWLDSVGYVVEISPMYWGGWNFAATICLSSGDRVIPNIIESTRQEATKQVIIKANQMYNERHEKTNSICKEIPK